MLRRDAARVLPIDPAGRALLLQARDPRRPGAPFWFTVGGALEPGETAQHGAARELHEETGIVVAAADLGSPFAQDTVRFAWDGRDFEQAQAYFALAVAGGDAVSFAGHDEWERATLVGHAWWSPEELQASGVAATPGLPELMRGALRHLGRATPAPVGGALTRAEALALRGSGWQPGPRPRRPE